MNNEQLTEQKEVKKMTRKLMQGIFLALILLLPGQLLAGEASSPGQPVAKVSTVPSDCGCAKQDAEPSSPGFRAKAMLGTQLLAPLRPNCRWYLVCVRHCTKWPGCYCNEYGICAYYYGDCMEYDYRCGVTFHGPFYE